MVHANWLFWTGFFLVLKPFLGLVSSKSDKLILLSDAKGGSDAYLWVLRMTVRLLISTHIRTDACCFFYRFLALLTYFDEDQIHLLEMDATPATYQSSLRLGSVRPSSAAAECSISCSQEGQFEKIQPVGSILRWLSLYISQSNRAMVWTSAFHCTSFMGLLVHISWRSEASQLYFSKSTWSWVMYTSILQTIRLSWLSL